jgi:hypothetical protein
LLLVPDSNADSAAETPGAEPRAAQAAAFDKGIEVAKAVKFGVAKAIAVAKAA